MSPSRPRRRAGLIMAGLSTAVAAGTLAAGPASAADAPTAPDTAVAPAAASPAAGDPTAAVPTTTDTRRARAVRANRAGASRARVVAPRLTPVRNFRLSAHYGQRGSLWSSGRHTGQDFSLPSGREVRAAQAGRVVFAGWGGPYGKSVVINHGKGVQTRYAHLSRLSVHRGERVTAGDRVGRVGSTGNSTGPHLHFEVIKHGKHRNPLTWLRNR
jgi:murein DD-endopeptidase MepM/ murein hydrolase activator NlpD